MSTELSSAEIAAEDLHALLLGDREFALLDVRDTRETTADGSILWAVSLPLSRLELNVRRLVPRFATPIITVDSGGEDDQAERAARRLGELGYTDVASLAGGVRAWSRAGFKSHTGGSHLIGQAFGEFIEEVYGTPHISVEELTLRIDRGDQVVILDSRPHAEFADHSLPGGTSIPGAELVYRASKVIPSPDALVVVNCAGRTRSILGAQTLINAGVPNRVVALAGGTLSWQLADLELEHGKVNDAPPPDAAGLEQAQAAARRIAARFGVQTIDHKVLRRFVDEQHEHTLYLLDVRTPEEFERRHLAGSRSAPSWDLAPWIFRHAATRNSRIVLVDDPNLVRATVAASWLIQLGWGQIFVLSDAFAGGIIEFGQPEHEVAGLADVAESLALLDAETLERDLRGSDPPHLIDLQPSAGYRRGHIPGAWFAVRSRLAHDLGALAGEAPIVFTSEDGALASLAAAETAALTDREVRALDGGTGAWVSRGFPLEEGAQRLLSEPNDGYATWSAEEDKERRKQAFRDYLSWEVALAEEIRLDSTVNFPRFE